MLKVIRELMLSSGLRESFLYTDWSGFPNWLIWKAEPGDFMAISGQYLILNLQLEAVILLLLPFSQTLSVTSGCLLWLGFLLQACFPRTDTHTPSQVRTKHAGLAHTHVHIYTQKTHMVFCAHGYTDTQYDFQSSKEWKVDSTQSRLWIPYQITHVSFP